VRTPSAWKRSSSARQSFVPKSLLVSIESTIASRPELMMLRACAGERAISTQSLLASKVRAIWSWSSTSAISSHGRLMLSYGSALQRNSLLTSDTMTRDMPPWCACLSQPCHDC
jgi:hypothetical protein